MFDYIIIVIVIIGVHASNEAYVVLNEASASRSESRHRLY